MKPLTRWRAGLGRLTPESRRKSYGLEGLDVRLARRIRLSCGVFIEAGANDGVRQSNTLYLEHYLGWRGVLVEPLPSLAGQAAAHRPRCHVENAALVARDFSDSTVELVDLGLMSTVRDAFPDESTYQAHVETACRYARGPVGGAVRAPAIPLGALWERLGLERVDLLSLDVEGYEAQVLDGLDLSRHQPRWILLEVRGTSRAPAVLEGRYDVDAVLSERENYRDVLFRLRTPT